MIDRNLVTSGFDTETLISEHYLSYILLAQIEAGRFPLQFAVENTNQGLDLTIVLHPPEDYERLYTPEPSAPLPECVPGSFAIELLGDDEDAFLHLSIVVTVIDNATNQEVASIAFGSFIDLELEADETDDGFERNHALRLSLVRFDDTTRAALEAAGADPDATEEEVRAQLDRTVPLGVASNQQVQQIRLRKFVDGGHRSVGFYVNLALRSGPERDALHPPRGDVEDAQDFRPSGSPLAFATSPDLFPLLGPDARFRQAEETAPGSGEFRFPLRKDPLNSHKEEIGKIKDISIGPEILIGQQTTGRLEIDLHGEYTDAPGDPDFHLQLLFEPKTSAGIVEWDLDVDVDVGLLATFLLVAAGIGLTLLFAPGAALGSTLLVGTIAGIAVLKELIAEPLAAKLIEDRLDEDAQASIFDALPFRLPAARRRWDPFYVTLHQIVSLVDEVVIDELGIAFQSTGLKLGKQPVPIGHVVIRDEERSPEGVVTALRHRVADFESIRPDVEANAPGRDRMDFTRAEPDLEPTLVSLTDAQIAERIGDDPKEKRILAPITYTAERIHVVENQIDSLLCLSRRERGELRRRLIDDFRESAEQEIRANQEDEIVEEVTGQLEQELGQSPTDEQIEEAVDKRVDELVDERQVDFEENTLPEQLHAAIARVLRFDLSPEEMIERQLAGVVFLDGKEIIIRENADGSVTPYYRDRPDADPTDNLLALPRYSPPYEPPG